MLVLSFLHLLAIASIILIAIPIILKLIIILFVLYSALTSAKQFAVLTSDSSIVKVSCLDKGKSHLELKNGNKLQANLVIAQWLLSYFAVLIFKSNSKTYKTVIAKDALSQEQFYTLRLYLRSLNTLR